MRYSQHYLNPVTKTIACSTGKRWSWSHQIRNWTENPDQVTCKKCRIQLEKWAKINKGGD